MLKIHAPPGEAKADLVSSAIVCRGHECHLNTVLWPDWEQTAIRISKGALKGMFQTELTTSIEMMFQENSPTKCSKKKNWNLSISWMYLTTISLGQRCININAYGKISVNNRSLVKLSLLSWTCVTLYTLVLRWKDSLFNRITGFYDPICTPIKTVIKKYSKTLRPGKLLTLIIFSRAIDAGSTTTVGPSTYSPISCVQSHACSWMSMAACLLKSNKDVLFKYLGLFETEPVDPEILTVDVQQLFYHILWPYGGTTPESIASHQSRLNVYVCHVNTNTCLPRMTREWESQVRQLLKCQNNKQCCPTSCRYSLSLKIVD